MWEMGEQVAQYWGAVCLATPIDSCMLLSDRDCVFLRTMMRAARDWEGIWQIQASPHIKVDGCCQGLQLGYQASKNKQAQCHIMTTFAVPGELLMRLCLIRQN